ncbi:helix-turn-helix transcriptional regulator [Acetobacterium bakii]|uniref:Excisionase n=1 Tax=Acetobacterium bakii TaxID=52689 RepID=A0A0L6U4E3_9FIRM|nr:helix-turn-helix transcriptional regulator [Acetobacterium bakii]KNZ43376.1 excisionase [Acetobacterium bakii]
MDNIALTAQDVADMLKIAKNTVYELIKRDELNSYKVGRKVRFTLSDVEAYIARSKCIQPAIPVDEIDKSEEPPFHPNPKSTGKDFIICGQDLMLDVLSSHIEKHPQGVRALRSYIGSYNSLVALYHGTVQVATAHLWDGDTGEYNVPFVRRLLPGIPTVIIHLTCRVQGFYVAQGNPKSIKTWSDLIRPDITMINREKGSGSRILLDEHFRLLGINGNTINGYHRESQSHFAVASTVGRGGADVALGQEKVAKQVKSVDFIPLQTERYDLVIKREDFDSPAVQAILAILNSEEFKLEFEGIEGYDISEMGKIIAEI